MMKAFVFNSAFSVRLFCLAVLACASGPWAGADVVRVAEQELTIPTYPAGPPEPNPMFYFGLNSQGAEGRVYPYPLYDSLTHVKSEKRYQVIYLENEYVRIGVLPEIGGRLFEAVDKSNGYNWVYRQHVIKPALIGLIGAWISGGLEWNIPHHHRATTFLPVQYRIEEEPDGSKTVWVGELEIRHRMRWAVGYTLAPGKSYLTAKVRILNRTPFAQSMLCFANFAVHANDCYQVIFPPETQFVTFHAKREFASWPIATGYYNGANFGDGTDVSWYSSHVEANSMFAWNYTSDFFGGYDHNAEAGTISVANHYIAPGKKFWTWGTGPRGRMWEKILTDTDGPYIELMTGAYSDNQPDYSWLQPFETKTFEMHWYPFRDIGGFKCANLDAAVNLEITNRVATLGFCTTAAHPVATVLLKCGDKELFRQENVSIDPAHPFRSQVALPAGTDLHQLRVSLSDGGREWIAYSPVQPKPAPMPKPVTAPPEPNAISSLEELYLTGLRIDQFHDPVRDPEPYWNEALRRDPRDARVNTALAIRELKQFKFPEAEGHLRTALDRLTERYTSPKNGEPFYYLGVALQAQERDQEAVDAFSKATWSEAWRDPAYFSIAELAAKQGRFGEALEQVNHSLEANARNVRALTLKAAILRHQGSPEKALEVVRLAGSQTDPLDVGLMMERWLDGNNEAANETELDSTLRLHPNNGLEVATEYSDAGLWLDGIRVLQRTAEASAHEGHVSPLVYYYLAEFSDRLGQSTEAARDLETAAHLPSDYVFPFQWEAISALRHAMKSNSRDARAPYYLGNLLFDSQPQEAARLWEESAAIDPNFSIVHRNLALAYEHAQPAPDRARAIVELEKAVALPDKYALHFAELDALYAKVGKAPADRLALLEANQTVVAQRDDALSREIGLKVFAGKYDDAIQLMTSRTFSVWEGGTLNVAEHWFNAHRLRGRRELRQGQAAQALADFKASIVVPDNLPSETGVGRGQQAELDYWIGIAQEASGNLIQAQSCWQHAVEGYDAAHRETTASRGSDSPLSSNRYYEALAFRKLGQPDKADALLHDLRQSAADALARLAGAQGQSSPSNGRRRPYRANPASAHYAAGLAAAGLGDAARAREEFAQTLRLLPDHLDAKNALNGEP